MSAAAVTPVRRFGALPFRIEMPIAVISGASRGARRSGR